MTVYRDSHGRTLEDYPRPSVAVDTAVLTVRDTVEVLVVRGGTDDAAGWRLPGSFLHPGERLADAVLRSLREKASVQGLSPAQLRVFDDPERDPRGWVLSVAHVDVVPAERLPELGDRAQLRDASAVGDLAFQHAAIVDAALAWLRDRYAAAPDPASLLREPFRLRELHALHEKVAGRALQRDTFRRVMLPMLEPTGEVERGGVGKPARLFRVRRAR